MTATEPTARVTVTAAHVEAALRGWLAHFEYDLHKATECNEETGEDAYPEEAADLFAGLVAAACPTPESHNWGCGCPTDRSAEECREDRDPPAEALADHAAAVLPLLKGIMP